MSSWKKITLGIKNDAHLVKKELVIFSVVYLVLNALSLISSLALPDLAKNPSLTIAFFSGTVLLCILLFINLYFFQRAYSEKKNVPVRIKGLWKTLLRVVQLYAVQMMILIGVMVVLGILLSLGLVVLHANKSISLIFVSIVMALAALVWIYRINFVTNIFMYERINWKSRAAIKESIYLIKTNASVILPLWFLSLFLLIPGIVENLQKPGINNPHILLNSLALVVSYLTSLIGVYITVQAVIEHNYYFLLKQEKTNELQYRN